MENSNKENPFKFEGKGSEFFGIWIVNLLLSVVTLGIYSAWAKVRTNQYFYGNTRLDGDGFEYHAKPVQILKGRIIAGVCFVIWTAANQLVPEVAIGLLVAFLAILPWLAWSNARFDSAMTSYRNVHFAFSGTLKNAYIAIVGRGAAIVALIAAGAAAVNFELIPVAVILFLAIPLVLVWVTVGIANYFANGYRYGQRQFSAQYTVGSYLSIYFKTMLFGIALTIAFGAVAAVFAGPALFAFISSGFDFSTEGWLESGVIGAVITLYVGFFLVGIVCNAYKAAQIRNYTFAQLKIEKKNAQDEEVNQDAGFAFESTLATWSFVGLIVTNFLLQLVTLGVARPWVMVRTSRYLADNTYVIGDLTNLVVEGEEQGMKSAISDELSDVFDVNLGIG